MNLPGAPPRTMANHAPHHATHSAHALHHMQHHQHAFGRGPVGMSVPAFMNRAEGPAGAAAGPGPAATVAAVAATAAPVSNAAAPKFEAAAAVATGSSSAAAPVGSPTGTGSPLTAAPELTPEQEFPEDRVYEAIVMLRFRSMTADLPDALRRFGMDLWSKVQDVTSRPEHMQVTRDDLFSGNTAAPQSRLIAERHLHHQVRGILARVTPEKYDSLKEELLQLPIRQSDQEDIKLVVQTFFTKAIRPEDAPYAKYYVRLISDMIQYIGPKEEAAKMIRKEIVTQCQAAFEHIDTLLTDPEASVGGAVSPDDLDCLRKMAKDKNKANINLLGYLFLNGLVPERVITNVLYSLLYGPGAESRKKHRHVPADFEIEMFIELMLNTGKKWTEVTKRFEKTFVQSMTHLSTTHPSKRIQFTLMDALEIVNNGFEPKKSRGPQKLSDFDESLQRNKAAMQASVENALRKPVAPPIDEVSAPQAKSLPSKRDVHTILDEGNTEAMISVMQEIPDQETRMEYCTDWLHRPMTVVRLSDQRDRIGATFANLMQARLFTADEIREIMKSHVKKTIADGEYLEMPRYFSHFVSVIRNGEGVLTTSLLTYLLRAVAEDENADKHALHMLIGEVQRQIPQCLEPNPHGRFRVLSTLLMQRPSFVGPDSMDSEQEDVLEDLELVETVLYRKLYDGTTVPQLLQWFNKQPDRGDATFLPKAICACFCYGRFDPAFACNGAIKELIKKLLTSTSPNARGPNEAACLSELYETWKELDKIPSDGFQQFVKWLQESQLLQTASIERFAIELSKVGKESDGDAQRLKMLVSR
eukprot:CAMPEP_0176428170 /NCGR_PEP_ID=MMETSP0127-20121128/13001_1 /TAXON_ID=938130 /ORGANISM="Platyophrya macrostoma, Strain WH" /LENGTH=812 /DNA_ID=CAMNT_0017809823 /DNA_START=212 /DNA_END=2650 /DNA_ORIENTATION=+